MERTQISALLPHDYLWEMSSVFKLWLLYIVLNLYAIRRRNGHYFLSNLDKQS